MSVARELLKQIYRAENLQPPSIAEFRSAYGTIWSRATSMPYWRETVRSREIVRLGIYGVEAYTIFKVNSHFILFLPFFLGFRPPPWNPQPSVSDSSFLS